MTEKELKKTKKIVPIPVYLPVIMELEMFQTVIDDPKQKMLVKDLRSWSGHINFIITQLLKDVSYFIIGNERITQIQEKMLAAEEEQKLRDEANGNYFS